MRIADRRLTESGVRNLCTSLTEGSAEGYQDRGEMVGGERECLHVRQREGEVRVCVCV